MLDMRLCLGSGMPFSFELVKAQLHTCTSLCFQFFPFIVPLTHSPLSKAVSKPASPYQDPGDRISPSRSPLQIQQGLFSKMYPPGNVPGGSTFNPNAPSFIPMALQQIPPPHVSIEDRIIVH